MQITGDSGVKMVDLWVLAVRVWHWVGGLGQSEGSLTQCRTRTVLWFLRF